MGIALALALVASTLGQPAGQPYIGRWAADHLGRPFVRLDLRMSNGVLVGSIQLADIHVDAQGDVDNVVGDLTEAKALFEITPRGQIVAFSRHNDNDVDHFEMSVIDDGAGELRFLLSDEERRELADNGIPLPRPIRLTRVTQ